MKEKLTEQNEKLAIIFLIVVCGSVRQKKSENFCSFFDNVILYIGSLPVPLAPLEAGEVSFLPIFHKIDCTTYILYAMKLFNKFDVFL